MDYAGLQALKMERSAIKRSLHLLGEKEIDAKEIQVIVACTRALNKIDSMIEENENMGWGDGQKTKDPRCISC